MQFFKRIGIVCDRIPEGSVATYGQLAALCGKPRCARQAGQALSRGAGHYAHRVVNSRGVLSGADAFVQKGLQRALLEEEGILFTSADTVDLSRYGWQPEEDELRELEALFAENDI